MANRGKTLDPEVFCIKDLKEKASKKLPKMYRGMCKWIAFMIVVSKVLN